MRSGILRQALASHDGRRGDAKGNGVSHATCFNQGNPGNAVAPQEELPCMVFRLEATGVIGQKNKTYTF
ncbi:MAG: hypothetical protein V7K88_20925 [Nostoc sp.]|uniref:hypothetical protein n=1 Tax=Nostoc sp. TaxID=1180 RepID=UPI002FF6A024